MIALKVTQKGLRILSEAEDAGNGPKLVVLDREEGLSKQVPFFGVWVKDRRDRLWSRMRRILPRNSFCRSSSDSVGVALDESRRRIDPRVEKATWESVEASQSGQSPPSGQQWRP